MFAILTILLSFLNLVQYIFTCIFLFCFHACYFFIRDCNTLGGNLIPYSLRVSDKHGISCSCVPVAQWLEHCVSSAKVVGSIPREHVLTKKMYNL